MVTWENVVSHTKGTGIYTASWAAPKADVHSQQRFHYMGHKGEVVVDQAHRGYTVCTDADGFASVNPLYMAYQPGPDGHFNGHGGYGYKSVESFVKAAQEINEGRKKPEDFDRSLPTLRSTAITTAILEAGRRSLDVKGAQINFVFDDKGRIAFA
jgi:D-galacturonate reductase